MGRDVKNPYGKPGKGNYGEIWQKFNQVPCPKCGAQSKTLIIDGNDVTLRCGNAIEGYFPEHSSKTLDKPLIGVV